MSCGIKVWKSNSLGFQFQFLFQQTLADSHKVALTVGRSLLKVNPNAVSPVPSVVGSLEWWAGESWGVSAVAAATQICETLTLAAGK